MAYFTWKEEGLTADCTSLEAMAARFEEAAELMRRMAAEGFRVERRAGGQHITHPDPAVFEAYGFISEERPERQLTVFPDAASAPQKADHPDDDEGEGGKSQVHQRVALQPLHVEPEGQTVDRPGGGIAGGLEGEGQRERRERGQGKPSGMAAG